MKIYDISQEVFSCTVFPGDNSPKYTRVLDMGKGDICSLTEFSMNAHNGTHVDAPAHFVADGKTIDNVPLGQFVGNATVAVFNGIIGADDAARLVETKPERLLLRGNAEVSLDAARIFAHSGLLLLGCEGQSFGLEGETAEAHRILLGSGMVLLEGVRLADVPDGEYLLCAAPLNLGGCEGAPCRAILIAQ